MSREVVRQTRKRIRSAEVGCVPDPQPPGPDACTEPQSVFGQGQRGDVLNISLCVAFVLIHLRAPRAEGILYDYRGPVAEAIAAAAIPQEGDTHLVEQLGKRVGIVEEFDLILVTEGTGGAFRQIEAV